MLEESHVLCHTSLKNNLIAQSIDQWLLLTDRASFKRYMCIAFQGDHLRVRNITCFTGAHSVTCHPTQVSALLRPGKPVLHLPNVEGWK